MTMDIVTITICCSLLLLAIISPFCNGLFRKPRQKTKIGDLNKLPSLSVVIAAHDSAIELQKNLPLILEQEYDGEFEVVVVDEASTDNTTDVIKLLKAKYPNLYSTFIPSTSRYLSRKKLALTIGMKAAKNEWVIITDANCYPTSKNWLSTMASGCSDDKDLVIGYGNYSYNTSAFLRYERLRTACYALSAAMRGTAYRCNTCNLALRKSVFMNNNGFLKNLKYLRGEYDFIVNEFASKNKTAIVLNLDATIRQEIVSRKMRIDSLTYYYETRKHLKRSFLYRFIQFLDSALLHISYVAIILSIIYAILTSSTVVLSVSLSALIITLALRLLVARKTIKHLKEELNICMIPFYEIYSLWFNIYLMTRHKLSDKHDFIRK